jgi:secondary thiamine-phosphate synthase enzyme
MRVLRVVTRQREELVDITEQVKEVARETADGFLTVYSPHTTAGIVINEAADPDVGRDIVLALQDSIKDDLPYRHGEGNSPAHTKAAIIGSSQAVPVVDGDLKLGTWQGVFLAEFDGPRTRTVYVG